jgi:CRISPR/Cas system-associated exonuclease Cas4 (RecB family)
MLDIPISKLREASALTINPDGTVNLQTINYSGLDMYLRCPEQFRRRYVEGKKSPPSVAMIEGTSHHKAAEEDNLSKRDKGKQLKPSQMVDIFEATWKDELVKGEKDAAELKAKLEWEDDNEETIRKRGKILQTEYATKYSAQIEPVGVEEPFMTEVDVRGTRFRLMGQMDVTTKDVVWDYKTSGRAKTDKDLGTSLQLSLYSWVKKTPKVSYVAFVKQAKPFVQLMTPATVGPGRWLWALEVIASAVDGIRRGSFPKTNPAMFPTPWWCSSRFCGYWADCRGKFES